MSYPYRSLTRQNVHYIQMKDEDDSPVWDDDQMFSNIHMCYWQGRQSEEWARHVCRKRGVDISEVDLRGFRANDGISLQELTRQEFCSIVGEQYGAMFWKELRSYRAMQKQRCQRCVGSDDISSLTYITNHKISVQENPSDLSYASLSRQNSPSPRFNQETSVPYPDHLAARTYEVYERSLPGSLSPNYQEQNIYPEVYAQRVELESALHQPPQQICLETNHRKAAYRSDHHHPLPPPRPLRPLPALISMDELESGTFIAHNEGHKNHYTHSVKSTDIERDLYEMKSSPPSPPVTIYTQSHTVYSPYSNASEGNAGHALHASLDVDGRYHTRVIQHPHDSHNQYSGQVYVQSQLCPGYHNFSRPSSIPSKNSSESDDDENEPGRLVIDIPDDGLEEHEMETEDSKSPQEGNRTVPHLKKIPTKRKRDRGPKSWEFLMRLLACPRTNPSIIRWENEVEGSFRLVQPQEIANMWGLRSNKEDLSYNNFARALRYHYKTKLLFKISERQLVYGCGPTALSFYRELLKEQNTSLDGSTIG